MSTYNVRNEEQNVYLSDKLSSCSRLTTLCSFAFPFEVLLIEEVGIKTFKMQ